VTAEVDGILPWRHADSRSFTEDDATDSSRVR